ncbi:MAG: O-antigen ligase family protein [bacterium]|nr:O-antigen ligase family protein [bacterium]
MNDKFIKKFNNKTILEIFTLLILIMVPFLKFLSENLFKLGVLKNSDSINPAILIYISVPFLIYIYVYKFIKEKRKLDIFDIIIFALIITGVIVTIFSISKYISIFGKDLRHEGFLTLMGYYLLFINWKIYGVQSDKDKFIKLIIIIAIINCLYALLQTYTNFNFIIRYTSIFTVGDKMASGLCGNPNFFGTLIDIVIGFVSCKYLIEKKTKWYLIPLIILFFVCLINSQSTGPFISYIALVLFLIIYLSIKKKLVLKKLIYLLLILISTYISIYYLNTLLFKASEDKNITYDDVCEMCNIKTTVKTGGNSRLTIWKNSLSIVKNNYLVGVGYDNFYLVYKDNLDDVNFNGVKIIVDKAHNTYLNMLVSSGILGFIPYILLLLTVFIIGLKEKTNINIILYSGFIIYSMQAFFNIDVIGITPIYYILMGLIVSSNEPKKNSYIY